jgi:glyoxylase-like metal-dependent hydrolase (beta-lactamase superfamily II)
MSDLWSPHLVETIEIRPWTVHAVADARFSSDGGVAFSMVPRMLWEREVRVTEAHTIPLRVGVLLLERPGIRIVVDTGIGERGVSRNISGFFGGLSAGGGLKRALHELGWSVDSVTHLVLTHMHVDHAGGAFDEEGRPSFPAARVIVSRRELTYARAPHPLRKPVFDTRAADLVSALPDLITVDRLPLEALPGVEVIPLGGHTPGLIGLRIHAMDRDLFVPGDLIPTRAHRRPRWVLSYDQDPSTVYEQRRRIVARAMALGWIVHFGHDPEVPFGRILAGGAVEAIPGERRGTALPPQGTVTR